MRRTCVFLCSIALAACSKSTAPPPDGPFAFSAHAGEPATRDVALHIRESLSATTPMHDQTLATMRAHGEAAVKVCVDEYRTLRESDYFHRWLLVYTLSEVEHARALPLFSELLARPPAVEHAADPHHGSTVEEEAIINLAAVHGVGQLAKAHNAQALALLEDVGANHADPSVAGQAQHEHAEAMR